MGQNELQLSFVMEVQLDSVQNQSREMVQSIDESKEALPSFPSITLYFVKPGDSLWKIAKRFYVTVDSIKEINELKEDVIYPGQELIIPKYQTAQANLSMV